MRRAQALAAPQRGQRAPRTPIPTAPLSLAGARPAAASPFRRPVPPPSLSQSRFESQDPWARLGSEANKNSTGSNRRQSRSSPRSRSRPEPEAGESKEQWDKLGAAVSELSGRPTQWSKSLEPRPELEAFTPRPESQSSPAKYKLKSRQKTLAAYAELQAEISRLSAGPKGRWTDGDLSAYEAEVKDLRVEESFREPKKERPPDYDAPTFLFPDLVLDLGADGAPGVRLYDSTDQELWNNKWSLPTKSDSASRERLVKYIDNANSASSAYRRLQETPETSHWHIRHGDVLSIALRGGPAPTAPFAPLARGSPRAVDEATRATESLLHKNGIPRVVWGDDATLLWWMDAREGEGRLQPRELPNLNDAKYASLDFQFDYGELRRLLSASVASGKGITGRTYPLERQVHRICSDVPDKPADLNSCYNVVSLIMDVEEALVMAGSRLSTLLCWTGLEHAVAGLYLGPAQHYLDLLIKRLSEAPANRLDVKPIVSMCVNAALRRLSRALEAVPEGANLSSSALLKLLTGSGGEQSDVSPSFLQLMSYKIIRDNSLGGFVHILAKVGALRGLWQAWRLVSQPQQGEGDDKEASLRMDMFTLVLVKNRDAVLAYDLKRGQSTEDPAHDLQRECDSMPTKAAWGLRPLEDAWVEYPSELPFKIASALEMDTADDAIEEIQRLMREYPGSPNDANRDPEKTGEEERRAEEEEEEQLAKEVERLAKEEEQLGQKA